MERSVKKMISPRAVLIVCVLLLSCFLENGYVFAEEDSYSFKTNGDVPDTHKFLNLRSRLQKNIKASERNKINFATAEYYFQTNALSDARRAFKNYAQQGSIDISSLLANVYLYKFAKWEGNEEKIETIKKEIFKNQFILLFEKYKVIKYTSLFSNEYEVRYFVDKIEILLNGDVFEKIGS